MDIKCEKCGTEYEFDDSRVTEDGVTVKCSTCGHLFKIRKKSFVLTEPVVLAKKDGGADDEPTARGGKNWMVRKADGTILSFKELTTLQKWIVERRVSREDEISKSGENWKRLGGIAELASFFYVVDQAAPVPSPQPAPAKTFGTQPLPAAVPSQFQPPQMGMPPPPAPYQSQPSFPSFGVPAAPTGSGYQTASIPPASSPPPMAPTQTYTSPPVPSSLPPTGPSTPMVVGQPGYPAMTVPPSQPAFASQPILPAGQPFQRSEPDSWGEPGFSDGGEDDVVEKWKRRGRRKWYFIVPVILIALGFGGFYLLNRGAFMKMVLAITGAKEEIPPLALAQFNTGYQHFLKDSLDEMGLAVQDFENAIREAKEKYPVAMAELAEVYITKADRMSSRVRRIDTHLTALEENLKSLNFDNAKEIPQEAKDKIASLLGQKQKLTEERQKLVEERHKAIEGAERWIANARQIDPALYEPKRALADLLRVKGADRSQVEIPLKESETLRKDEPELLYIEGAIASEDAASADTALQYLNQAMEAQQRNGKPDLVRARYKMAELLVNQKRTDEAKVQLERILQVSPTHEAAKELLASLAPPPPEPKPPEKKEEKPPAPAQPTTYDGWMTLANKMLNASSPKQALDAFDGALSLKPNDVEALTGTGLSLLDMGSYTAAATAFKKALRFNPNFADALMGIAESYRYLNNKEEAVKYYERYLEIVPNGPDAAVARRAITELK
jgi:predicted Zn finger-like uncharacterized protein